MSSEHRLEDVDLEGDAYKAIWLPQQPHGAVVDLCAPNVASLDKPRAVRLALFLLKAAGVDLVGVARKVVEGKREWDAAPNFSDVGKAQLTIRQSINELAAVLKTIDGEAP